MHKMINFFFVHGANRSGDMYAHDLRPSTRAMAVNMKEVLARTFLMTLTLGPVRTGTEVLVSAIGVLLCLLRTAASLAPLGAGVVLSRREFPSLSPSLSVSSPLFTTLFNLRTGHTLGALCLFSIISFM